MDFGHLTKPPPPLQEIGSLNNTIWEQWAEFETKRLSYRIASVKHLWDTPFPSLSFGQKSLKDGSRYSSAPGGGVAKFGVWPLGPAWDFNNDLRVARENARQKSAASGYGEVRSPATNVSSGYCQNVGFNGIEEKVKKSNLFIMWCNEYTRKYAHDIQTALYNLEEKLKKSNYMAARFGDYASWIYAAYSIYPDDDDCLPIETSPLLRTVVDKLYEGIALRGKNYLMSKHGNGNAGFVETRSFLTGMSPQECEAYLNYCTSPPNFPNVVQALNNRRSIAAAEEEREMLNADLFKQYCNIFPQAGQAQAPPPNESAFNSRRSYAEVTTSSLASSFRSENENSISPIVESRGDWFDSSEGDEDKETLDELELGWKLLEESRVHLDSGISDMKDISFDVDSIRSTSTPENELGSTNELSTKISSNNHAVRVDKVVRYSREELLALQPKVIFGDEIKKNPILKGIRTKYLKKRAPPPPGVDGDNSSSLLGSYVEKPFAKDLRKKRASSPSWRDRC